MLGAGFGWVVRPAMGVGQGEATRAGARSDSPAGVVWCDAAERVSDDRGSAADAEPRGRLPARLRRFARVPLRARFRRRHDRGRRGWAARGRAGSPPMRAHRRPRPRPMSRLSGGRSRSPPGWGFSRSPAGMRTPRPTAEPAQRRTPGGPGCHQRRGRRRHRRRGARQAGAQQPGRPRSRRALGRGGLAGGRARLPVRLGDRRGRAGDRCAVCGAPARVAQGARVEASRATAGDAPGRPSVPSRWMRPPSCASPPCGPTDRAIVRSGRHERERRSRPPGRALGRLVGAPGAAGGARVRALIGARLQGVHRRPVPPVPAGGRLAGGPTDRRDRRTVGGRPILGGRPLSA